MWERQREAEAETALGGRSFLFRESPLPERPEHPPPLFAPPSLHLRHISPSHSAQLVYPSLFKEKPFRSRDRERIFTVITLVCIWPSSSYPLSCLSVSFFLSFFSISAFGKKALWNSRLSQPSSHKVFVSSSITYYFHLYFNLWGTKVFLPLELFQMPCWGKLVIVAPGPPAPFTHLLQIKRNCVKQFCWVCAAKVFVCAAIS